jgi:small subunit ribosomal protein S9
LPAAPSAEAAEPSAEAAEPVSDAPAAGDADAPAAGDADAPAAGDADAPPPSEAPEPPEAFAPPEDVPPQAAAPLDAEPPAEEPAPQMDPAVTPESAPAAGAPEDRAAVQEQPAQAAAPGLVEDEEELEEEDLGPREKPEIPGADLIPDIVPEGEQFLDAEAQAAAEAEAEAAAARAEEEEPEDRQAMPIADAAIDLAAGARYTATGKRKTAVARVVLKPGTGTYAINGKPLETFFPREPLQRMIRQPLETVGYDARMDVVARMHGGGVAAQAGALRHGISRALIVADPNLRGELKRRGFLTRDPRVKERKKAGLKKARKRPQFSKR